MSRMSPTPERNCRARSIPIPNAKPENSSGSMPQAISTRGLTIPQPPHSTQRAPSRCSGNQTSNSADGSVNGK